jgi:AcrR family transcriptional regulator
MSPGRRTSSRGAASKGLEPDSNGLGRERLSDIQRARMLAAMTEVAVERGVANVTVTQVVARSGVSRRTFYEIFEDREECFLVAFDDAVGRIATAVTPEYEQPGSWRAKTRAALIALLECLDYEPGTGRLLIIESLGAGSRALERRQNVLAQVITIIDEGRTESKRGEGPPPLTAEGVVSGVLGVLHARLLENNGGSLLELTGPLMSMIVLPYLGNAAASKELQQPVPECHTQPPAGSADPLRDLEMRLTYRTVRVLMAVAEQPGSSNRQVGVASGMRDQGQISKLLSRLHRLGLIQNAGVGPTKGAPNAWTLTPKGAEVERAIGQ